ncbi:unnamed protein product [Caenorhabditis sp. 36 PRJEB53466]|nr:unnamed protein product [Caenorhabditis sp. 36 PRJEB53466]
MLEEQALHASGYLEACDLSTSPSSPCLLRAAAACSMVLFSSPGFSESSLIRIPLYHNRMLEEQALHASGYLEACDLSTSPSSPCLLRAAAACSMVLFSSPGFSESSLIRIPLYHNRMLEEQALHASGYLEACDLSTSPSSPCLLRAAAACSMVLFSSPGFSESSLIRIPLYHNRMLEEQALHASGYLEACDLSTSPSSPCLLRAAAACSMVLFSSPGFSESSLIRIPLYHNRMLEEQALHASGYLEACDLSTSPSSPCLLRAAAACSMVLFSSPGFSESSLIRIPLYHNRMLEEQALHASGYLEACDLSTSPSSPCLLRAAAACSMVLFSSPGFSESSLIRIPLYHNRMLEEQALHASGYLEACDLSTSPSSPCLLRAAAACSMVLFSSPGFSESSLIRIPLYHNRMLEEQALHASGYLEACDLSTSPSSPCLLRAAAACSMVLFSSPGFSESSLIRIPLYHNRMLEEQALHASGYLEACDLSTSPSSPCLLRAAAACSMVLFSSPGFSESSLIRIPLYHNRMLEEQALHASGYLEACDLSTSPSSPCLLRAAAACSMVLFSSPGFSESSLIRIPLYHNRMLEEQALHASGYLEACDLSTSPSSPCLLRAAAACSMVLFSSPGFSESSLIRIPLYHNRMLEEQALHASGYLEACDLSTSPSSPCLLRAAAACSMVLFSSPGFSESSLIRIPLYHNRMLEEQALHASGYLEACDLSTSPSSPCLLRAAAACSMVLFSSPGFSESSLIRIPLYHNRMLEEQALHASGYLEACDLSTSPSSPCLLRAAAACSMVLFSSPGFSESSLIRIPLYHNRMLEEQALHASGYLEACDLSTSPSSPCLLRAAAACSMVLFSSPGFSESSLIRIPLYHNRMLEEQALHASGYLEACDLSTSPSSPCLLRAAAACSMVLFSSPGFSESSLIRIPLYHNRMLEEQALHASGYLEACDLSTSPSSPCLLRAAAACSMVLFSSPGFSESSLIRIPLYHNRMLEEQALHASGYLEACDLSTSPSSPCLLRAAAACSMVLFSSPGFSESSLIRIPLYHNRMLEEQALHASGYLEACDLSTSPSSPCLLRAAAACSMVLFSSPGFSESSLIRIPLYHNRMLEEQALHASGYLEACDLSTSPSSPCLLRAAAACSMVLFSSPGFSESSLIRIPLYHNRMLEEQALHASGYLEACDLSTSPSSPCLLRAAAACSMVLFSSPGFSESSLIRIPLYHNRMLEEQALHASGYLEACDLSTSPSSPCLLRAAAACSMVLFSSPGFSESLAHQNSTIS